MSKVGFFLFGFWTLVAIEIFLQQIQIREFTPQDYGVGTSVRLKLNSPRELSILGEDVTVEAVSINSDRTLSLGYLEAKPLWEGSSTQKIGPALIAGENLLLLGGENNEVDLLFSSPTRVLIKGKPLGKIATLDGILTFIVAIVVWCIGIAILWKVFPERHKCPDPTPSPPSTTTETARKPAKSQEPKQSKQKK